MADFRFTDEENKKIDDRLEQFHSELGMWYPGISEQKSEAIRQQNNKAKMLFISDLERIINEGTEQDD